MAWIIVNKEINYRRTKGAFFHILASKLPQNYPHDVAEYAVKNGYAINAAPPKRKSKHK